MTYVSGSHVDESNNPNELFPVPDALRSKLYCAEDFTGDRHPLCHLSREQIECLNLGQSDLDVKLWLADDPKATLHVARQLVNCDGTVCTENAFYILAYGVKHSPESIAPEFYEAFGHELYTLSVYSDTIDSLALSLGHSTNRIEYPTLFHFETPYFIPFGESAEYPLNDAERMFEEYVTHMRAAFADAKLKLQNKM